MSGTIIFVGGQLINGKDKDPVSDSVVVIENKHIVYAGSKEGYSVPPQEMPVDITGHTIMPGLIDAHTHCSWDGDVSISAGILKDFLAKRVMKAYLNFKKTLLSGITTVREVGTHAYIDIAIRDLINDGSLQGPRILASGKGLTQTGGHARLCSGPPWIDVDMGHIAEVADGKTECQKAVRKQITMGCDLIKLWATSGVYDAFIGEPRREFSAGELKAIVEEANFAGRKVAAHAHTPEAIHDCLEAGAASIEHGMFITEANLELMVRKGAFWVPTISVYHNIANGETRGVMKSAVKNAAKALEVQSRSFEKAMKMGVKIVMGTDAGSPLTYHGENALELELMNDRGMSNMDCIIASTGMAARLLGIDETAGTIEKGKLADVIVVQGDPLQDIRIVQNADKIACIVKEGEMIKNDKTN